MTKFSLIIATAVVVSGCSTLPDYKFAKAGATEADFHRDKTQCDDEAFSAANVLRLTYIEARNNCLVKKGLNQVAPK